MHDLKYSCDDQVLVLHYEFPFWVLYGPVNKKLMAMIELDWMFFLGVQEF